MPKNIVQDVIPRGERKRPMREVFPLPINRDQDVPKAENSIPKNYRDDENDTENFTEEAEENDNEQNFHFQKPVNDGSNWESDVPNKKSHWLLWLIGGISAIVLIFVIGNLFSGATVTITPKSDNFSVDLDLTAKSAAATGELGYTIYSLSGDKEQVVPADGERPVEAKASGTIIVYNNYTTSSQRLVKNTRFETPDGLIYRIANSITIPGRHAVAGVNVPGSVETEVFAESAGEKYNIGLSDFTIPGFKSNPDRFTNFYARSKTAMTGGLIGTEKFISDTKLGQTKAQIETELTKELVAEAMANVPDDSVFYDSAYKISFEPVISSSKANGNNMSVVERAHLTAFFLKRDELAKAISQNVVAGYDGSPVTIAKPENLQYTEKVTKEATNTSQISFNIKGKADIIWKFDETKLRSDLTGKSKNELSKIAERYPAIIKAEAVIRPFWKGSFPASTDKIKFMTTELQS